MWHLFILLFGFGMNLAEKSLSDLRWENRILITYGYQFSHDLGEEALNTALKERKLLFFHLDENGLLESNFEGKINVDELLLKNREGQISWVLIGLDGGTKRNEKGKAKLNEILAIIDAMPMRQSEIRRKGR